MPIFRKMKIKHFPYGSKKKNPLENLLATDFTRNAKELCQAEGMSAQSKLSLHLKHRQKQLTNYKKKHFSLFY